MNKPSPTRHVLMLAYTIYPSDARVMREAETVAALENTTVTVLALKQQDRPRSYTKNGVTIVELNVLKYRGKRFLNYGFSYLRFLLHAFLKISRLALGLRADIVHVHNMPNFVVFAALIPKLLGRPVILDIHDSMPETYAAKFDHGISHLLYWFLSLEEIVCAGFADRVICVNHVQKDAIRRRHVAEKKLTVCINVPDPKLFPYCHTPPYQPERPQPFNLVYHGTLSKRLGVDLTIEAVARLVERIPEIQFHVIGSGDDLDAFIQLSRDLNIESSVRFSKKMVPVDELINILEGMHIGVISNRRNIATDLMLPVKMLEYVALGVPVVAPSLAGVKYYFDDTMIQLFEPGNLDSLADAIETLYRQSHLRRKRAENAMAFLRQYGWNKHKYALINLYQSLGGKN